MDDVRALEPVSQSAVPDVLAPGLRVVFCGINPGRVSAAARAHFANPRNDFWRLLHAAGFTPRQLEPNEQFALLDYGLGATNAAFRMTPGSGDLRRRDFEGAVERLERIAEELAPAWLAFVGKEAYRGAFGHRAELGLQDERLDSTALFVLPSTSPANAAVPWTERLRWFQELADLSALIERPGVRALLLDDRGRIFLHRFVSSVDPGVWVAPGGARERGESAEAALRRELREELTLDGVEFGPWVWKRRHRWFWLRMRATYDSQEQFSVVRVADREALRPTAHDSLVAGPRVTEEHRWWSVAEIEASHDKFSPRRLASLLTQLLEHGPPAEPIDVGV